MDYLRIIHYIEDESIKLDSDFYYHAFDYNQDEFISMITEGIKAPILLGKLGDGNNGKFYVSLARNVNCSNSIYNKLSGKPMFMINNKILTVKARNSKIYGMYPMFLMQSPLPFRDCEYDDEYQKFLKVSAKDILAIQYNIFSNFQKYNDKNNDYIRCQLLTLKQMIEDLESQKVYLPIIDASTSTKINTGKVLSLKL